MKEAKKKFSLTFADLAMFTSNLVGSMNRDSTEFAARGVDAAAITALQALGDSFEVFPTDEFYVGAIQIEVDAKNALRESSTLMIQTISGYFEQKWGIKSGEYKQLRIRDLQQMSDNNYLVAARAVVSVATLYISDLTPIGLTQAEVDALSAEAQLFEDKLNAVAEKRKLRDDKARERVDLANNLYDYVVTYCKIGKLIWENVNEAKYNDYIIYKTTKSSLSKPQNLAAALDPVTVTPISLSWDLVADATSYDVYVNIAATGAPAGSFSLLNNFTVSPALLPAIFEKRNYFKIKAKNDTETSVYSDEVYVDVPAAP